MKALIKELRQYAAEKLLSWAWSITSDQFTKDHIIQYFENQKDFKKE